MKNGIQSSSILVLFLVLVLVLTSTAPTLAAPIAPRDRVLVFVSDGMRHDLMRDFASEGVMPTYQNILTKGVQGEHGMIPNVPPNTGPGWTALATGAPPAINGVTNNSFHDNNESFANPYYWGTSAWTAGVNQAQTLMEKAEQSGLSVAVLGWQTFDPSLIQNGWVVESYPDWLTTRGIVANYDVPLTWTHLLGLPNPFTSFSNIPLEDAVDWVNVPTSFSPAKESYFIQVDWTATPVLDYDLYLYDQTDDGVTNYDSVLVAPEKDGSLAVAVLGAGQWSDEIRVDVGGLAGGFYVKVIDLTADLSQFRLYFTPATRYRAYPESLEEELVANFPAMRPSDYNPYLLGLIDAQTFVEQHMQQSQVLGDVYAYILKQYKPDLGLVGNESTDAVQHRFLSLALPESPSYDPVNGPTYWAYIQEAYANADAMLAKVSHAMPDAAVFVTSDHGFSPTSQALNAGYVLEMAGLYDPFNRANSQAVPFAAGGTLQVYINLEGRNPDGIVPADQYETVRQQIVDAFEALGPDLIERVLVKEETAAIETAEGETYNMLHEDRTGDVVVFSRPPYQFDAASAGLLTAEAPIYGQHGFVPNGDPDRYSVFAAAGPKIVKGLVLPGVTVLDLAPTVAYLLGIDPPEQSQGEVLDIFRQKK